MTVKKSKADLHPVRSIRNSGLDPAVRCDLREGPVSEARKAILSIGLRSYVGSCCKALSVYAQNW